MEKQGVSGPKPRFLLGNIMDMASLVEKSTSQDMDTISHNVVGRLLPHFVVWSKLYGKRFIYWNGIEPRMCLTETELIKELLSKYNSISGKSWLQQQGSKHFIGKGLLMANSDDWYHQRRIIAPAFMGDKLKSYAGYMVECTKQMLQSLESAVKEGQTEFEIGEHMTRLTSDIISRTEFDRNYEKGKQIFHLLTLLQQLCAKASKNLCFPGSRCSLSNGLFCSDRVTSVQHYPSQIENNFLILKWIILVEATDPTVNPPMGVSCTAFNSLLSMVINESLRLYPPATVLPRMAFDDIRLGDLHIPKGLSIWIPVLAIHHSEEIWGKDVNEFNPDRFASKSFAPGRHFIPFAAGPRNCIGQSFALMEAKIILAMLISKFSFTISDNYRHAPVIVLTIKPKYGVQICLKSLNP
ncbi:cytokinin hydroxylase [Olea europaea subsp. europaea]|uniref:Cytokinin hydroxylase n=1 Tax=Olea europaea subsp. europaea TaxID=158383 RepID=A0A8S0Q288_OLEEU|nr:cytokinin hydroxylase [Olea europaea subsp. europaea]